MDFIVCDSSFFCSLLSLIVVHYARDCSGTCVYIHVPFCHSVIPPVQQVLHGSGDGPHHLREEWRVLLHTLRLHRRQRREGDQERGRGLLLHGQEQAVS